MRYLISTVFLATAALFLISPVAGAQDELVSFENLTERYLDEMPALNPVYATQLGDHRFDGQMGDLSAEGRARELAFAQSMLADLQQIDKQALPRARQIDFELLENQLRSDIFSLETLQEWAWNPVAYTQYVGGSIYALMARDFAPVAQRLGHVTDRLEQFPTVFEQIRQSLDPARVPKVHATTAASQNQGVLSIIDNLVRPEMEALDQAGQDRLTSAIAIATEAVEAHQQWLEDELVPAASGDFRIGADLFDQKLAYTLNATLSRDEIRRRAQAEFDRVRAAMFDVAKTIYAEKYPLTTFPEQPSDDYRQAIIRAALEVIYEDLPARGEIVATAKKQLAQTREFVVENDIVTMPDDPVDIIIMPEFQRGVAVAYCDAPGPLEKGGETYYAVAPLPEDWTDEQVTSFLREYNIWSLQDLAIHEAIPGHYLQLSLANRYPSVLRNVLSSGPFIEGWAVYAEDVMVNSGYLDHDPRFVLSNLKWYLRAVTNALMDQAIHVDGMTEDEAMQLMVEGGFQEEREAAGKWVRAQLSSTQLSTYFVGAQEHFDMREAVEQAWGDDFEQRRYHDQVLSYGSPPVRYVRELILNPSSE